MGNNVYHIEPQGSTLEKAIINALNFVVDIVFETIIKPNSKKLETNVADTEMLKSDNSNNLEQILDTQYELNMTKDEVVEQLEQQLDLEFRVAQLEDSIGG